MIQRLDNRTWKRNGLTVTMSGLEMLPTARRNGRRRVWLLSKDFFLTIQSNGLFQSVTVPTGYETDMASMPVFTQVFLGNRDDPGVLESSIIHDFCCSTHVPAWICNSWLRAAMYACGVPKYKRILFFWAVHLVGYESFTQRSWKWLKRKISRDRNSVASKPSGE